MINRRKLLMSIALGSTVGIAGCTGETKENNSESEAEVSEQENGSVNDTSEEPNTEEETEAESEVAAQESESTDGATNVVRQFLNAAANGDTEQQDELIYGGSSIPFDQEGFELTIATIEQGSAEGYIEWVEGQGGISTGYETGEELRDAVRQFLEEEGLDGPAFIYSEYNIDETTESYYFIMGKSETGEWLIIN